MFAALVEDGHEEALPDYIDYLATAEAFNCAPWDLFEPDDTMPPKWWWMAARRHLDRARSDAKGK